MDYGYQLPGATECNRRRNQLHVWIYWEGDCPEWVRRCQRTILAHAPRARLLGPADFDALWSHDRDIDLTRLRVAHRADFIRAFLLARYGGLWIDSDCIVMRPLEEALNALKEYDFIAHRERQGYYSNGFIGARPGSEIAAEFYLHICERLRSGQSLGWISLGGEPLTALLRQTQARWRELPCDYIQPICWSRQEAFFVRGDADQHARRIDHRALCYMLCNSEIRRYQAAHPGTDLLARGTFFRYLLTQAMDERSSQQ